ncbi:unnamed protein product [Lampetra fluviatilis]
MENSTEVYFRAPPPCRARSARGALRGEPQSRLVPLPLLVHASVGRWRRRDASGRGCPQQHEAGYTGSFSATWRSRRGVCRCALRTDGSSVVRVLSTEVVVGTGSPPAAAARCAVCGDLPTVAPALSGLNPAELSMPE